MELPINWRMLMGGAFLALSVFLLLNHYVLEAAWTTLIGLADLGIVFGQDHPQLGQGWLSRILFVSWTVAFVWLTLELIP